jgi:phage shock protein C
MMKAPLYRDPNSGRVAGVCAGIAQSFGLETWLVRIIAFAFAVTNFALFFILYLAGWLLLDKKPLDTFQDDTDFVTVKSNVWQRGASPKQVLHDLDRRLDRLEGRIQRMEHVVTSRVRF